MYTKPAIELILDFSDRLRPQSQQHTSIIQITSFCFIVSFCFDFPSWIFLWICGTEFLEACPGKSSQSVPCEEDGCGELQPPAAAPPVAAVPTAAAGTGRGKLWQKKNCEGYKCLCCVFFPSQTTFSLIFYKFFCYMSVAVLWLSLAPRRNILLMMFIMVVNKKFYLYDNLIAFAIGLCLHICLTLDSAANSPGQNGQPAAANLLQPPAGGGGYAISCLQPRYAVPLSNSVFITMIDILIIYNFQLLYKMDKFHFQQYSLSSP